MSKAAIQLGRLACLRLQFNLAAWPPGPQVVDLGFWCWWVLAILVLMPSGARPIGWEFHNSGARPSPRVLVANPIILVTHINLLVPRL